MNLPTFIHCCCPGFSGFAANKLIRLLKTLIIMGGYLLSLGILFSRRGHSGDPRSLGKPNRRKNNICPELAATVFNYAREGIIIADPSGQIVRVNEAFTRITGYGQDEVLGRNLKSRGMVQEIEVFYTPMKNALTSHGHWSGEVRSSHKNGTELMSRISISVVRGSNGDIQHYVALLSNITQVEKRLQLLTRDAHYDPLTQLPNRLLLTKRMRQALGSARTHQHRLAIAFIDLDGFKAINDSYGHDLGDRVLQIIAKRVMATIREHDTLARFGGDEFVAALVGLQQLEDCEPVLKRMLQAARAPIVIDAKTVQVSASIGVAFFPEHGQEIEALIGKADQAMYLSKRSGGNRLAFCSA